MSLYRKRNREVDTTSGGADSVPSLTVEEEKVLAILGPETLKGMTFTVRAFEEHANIPHSSSNLAVIQKVPQHC